MVVAIAAEYSAAPKRLPNKQGGVALAIVLWFLAGMSLLVAGIVHMGRMDVKMAQVHSSQAKVVAAGDGAIHLMMATFLRDPSRRDQEQLQLSANFELGALPVRVRMVPASGLVDIYHAPPNLLAALFAARGALEPAEAEQLAKSVLELRARTFSKLVSPEDLLRVPGFNRALLDALRDDIRAVQGGGGLSWAKAPAEVLAALEQVDPQRVAAIAAKRDATELGQEMAAGESLFRVDAIVDLGGQQWLRRRWVKMESGGSGGSELPWSFMRTESPRVAGNGI
ncbi:general secretion pathway protein GspK [Parahaliea sp. F7430]|uniref:General secretion pathway protein GspK n=1 Tax=Sediminihaliea albiluteola TaxID=2758564 RepID=A0A7W2TYH4_9GAMM|nr:general secretion pathway protein GspK [Sediminihaliea albiluteola]MBA6414270.1 general secretion pathway protein GspK [Sediminihaliea albiluteola]